MDNKKAKVLKNAMLSFWGKYNISVITAGLLACSVFYFIGARQLRAFSSADNPELFATGDTVNIQQIIDGDELLLANDDDVTTKLRLLGINSFSAKVSDPLLSEYGKICFDYLKATVAGKNVRLVVDEKVLDNKGRLLGTVYLADSEGKYTVDLALELVKKGYTLVYTRFDFKDMDTYLEAQKRARDANAGFWSNERIAARASAMLLLWEEEKRND